MLKPTVDVDVIPFSKNFENKTIFFTSLYMADEDLVIYILYLKFTQIVRVLWLNVLYYDYYCSRFITALIFATNSRTIAIVFPSNLVE